MAETPGVYGTIYIVKKNGQLGNALPLDRCEDDVPGDAATRNIGSAENADIRIHMPTVEDKHATVELRVDGSTWIVNESEANPIEVNGEKLAVGTPHLLSKEVELAFCGRKFVYKPTVAPASPDIAAEPEPAAAPLSATPASPLRRSASGSQSPRSLSASNSAVAQAPESPRRARSTDALKNSQGAAPVKAAPEPAPAAPTPEKAPVAEKSEEEKKPKTPQVKTPPVRKVSNRPPASVQVHKERPRPSRRLSSGEQHSPSSFKLIKLIGASIDKQTHVGTTGIVVPKDQADEILKKADDVLSPEDRAAFKIKIVDNVSLSPRMMKSPVVAAKSPRSKSPKAASLKAEAAATPRSRSPKATTPKKTAEKADKNEEMAETEQSEEDIAGKRKRISDVAPSTPAAAASPAIVHSSKKSRPAPKVETPIKSVTPSKSPARSPKGVSPIRVQVATPEQRAVLLLKAREALRADPEFRAELKKELAAETEEEWRKLHVAPLAAQLERLTTALEERAAAIKLAEQHSTASLEAELNKRRALEETTAKELGHLRAELLRKEEELADAKGRADKAFADLEAKEKKRLAEVEADEKRALAALAEQERKDLEASLKVAEEEKKAKEAEEVEKQKEADAKRNKRKSVGGRRAATAEKEAAEEEEKKEEEPEPAAKKGRGRQSLAASAAKKPAARGRRQTIAAAAEEKEEESAAPAKEAEKPASPVAAKKDEAPEETEESEKPKAAPKGKKKAAAKRGKKVAAAAEEAEEKTEEKEKKEEKEEPEEPKAKRGLKPAPPAAEGEVPKATKGKKKAAAKRAVEEKEKEEEKEKKEPAAKKRATRGRH